MRKHLFTLLVFLKELSCTFMSITCKCENKKDEIEPAHHLVFE